MARRQRALTLVEVLAVCAIVAVLAATVLLVAGPRLKRAAKVADVKQRLRQLAFAVRIYMADNDDRPPLTLASVAGTVSLRDPFNGGSLLYAFDQTAEERRGLDWEAFGFDPAVSSIIRAPGVNNHTGRTETLMVPDGSGGFTPFPVPLLEPGQRVKLLGARLDSSLGWFASPEDWEQKLPPVEPPPGQ